MDIDELIEQLEDDLVSCSHSLQTLDLMIVTHGLRGQYSEELFSLQRTLEELHNTAFEIWETGEESEAE